MTGRLLKRVFIAVMFLITCLPLMSACGDGASLHAPGNSKPATCFEIKSFTVLHVAPIDHEKEICRLELNPPPGFEFVDKTGKRLPYHPYVLVKPN